MRARNLAAPGVSRIISFPLSVAILGTVLLACSPEINSGRLTGGSSSSDSTLVGSDGVWISLVSKDVRIRHLGRFATRDHAVVASRAEIPEAVASHYLSRRSDEDLAFLEPAPRSLAAMRTGSIADEVLRLDGIVVVRRPRGSFEGSVHERGDPLTHVMAIERSEWEMLADDEGPQLLPGSDDARALGQIRIAGALPPLTSIDRAFLEARVREISGATPVTIGGRTLRLNDRGSAQGRADVLLWLKAQYEPLGFVTSTHDYTTSGFFGTRTGRNFVATRPGTAGSAASPRRLFVTSHLDSVNNPGADDNGAGTVSALAVARYVAAIDSEIELTVMAFDQEELGLVGSTAFVRDLTARGQLADILGVVNIEMTGYDSDGDGALHVIDCNENTSARITRVMDAARTGAGLPLRVEPACTNRSDHAPFWRAGVPAVVISQNFFGGDANPCYHRACDKVDTMNLDYMTNVTRMIAAGTAALFNL